MNKISMFLVILFGSVQILLAQTDLKNSFVLSGYAEVYYQQDFSNPIKNVRPNFIYSHNKNNEFNLNLGFIKASYNTDMVRANLALATGTYMNANYVAEPGTLQNIYEANIGVKLSSKYDLWLDVGILPSHIGSESAVSKDCYTLTRSIAAENSPYFETGAKVTYATQNAKWIASILILNGWQHIQKIDGNRVPSFGHQLIYKPNERIIINSSSFVGNEKPDSLRQMRYFHNLYALYNVSDKFGVIAGFDIGMEQKPKSSDNYNAWYSPYVIVKYKPSTRFAMAVRGEYYQDKNGVVISTESSDGFEVYGYSVNADYYVTPNVVWRTELKHLTSESALFIDSENKLSKINTSFVTSLAINF
ncbi:MAG: porin [Candidatus Saccharimonadaceae bacterium]